MNKADDTTNYGFLFGADMEPGKIRRNPLTSESRFAGIGSIPAASVAHLDLRLPAVEEIWGVVVTLPQPAKDAPQAPVALLLSETVVQAVVLTDGESFGAISDALTEAYYWELPRAWRNTLEGMGIMS